MASAERQVIACRPQPVLDPLAVLGTAGLDLQDDLDLVHPQGRRQPLVADLEHVPAELGDQSEQGGERARVVRHPAAPAGSTTCLARSRQSSRPRASAASDTVTIRSAAQARIENGMSPGRWTAIPSAMVGSPMHCTGCPSAIDATIPGTAADCTPTIFTSGSSDFTATV